MCVHKTDLTPPPSIAVPVPIQETERGHVFVCYGQDLSEGGSVGTSARDPESQ